MSCLKNAKSTLLWRNSPRTWEQPYDMTHPSSRARPIEGWRTIWKKEGTNVWEERRAYRYSRVLRVDVLRLSDEVHSGRNGTKYDYDKMMYLIITFSAGFGAYWIFAQGWKGRRKDRVIRPPPNSNAVIVLLKERGIGTWYMIMSNVLLSSSPGINSFILESIVGSSMDVRLVRGNHRVIYVGITAILSWNEPFRTMLRSSLRNSKGAYS